MAEFTPRDLLERCYAAAVRSANPAAATRAAVAALAFDGAPWIIALGKGAAAMARGACEALAERGLSAGGGIVISHEAEPVPPPLASAIGDHPVPGAHSARAAERLSHLVARMPTAATALVLLSGGTTSLAAAPVDDIAVDELRALFTSLLGSGADIGTMNALRKRVLRWGGGRLALALAPRQVHCLIVSDVIGNDIGAIGSGPCAPDPLTAHALHGMLAARGLDDSLPAGVRGYIDRVRAGGAPETPKPGDACFAHVATHVLLDVRSAMEAAAAEARAAGLTPVHVVAPPLVGDAATAGVTLAREAAGLRASLADSSLGTARRTALVYGGETTVRLGPGRSGAGGRCQELALAAAGALHEMGPHGLGVTLLAAGTDGRDGPTDAAGAVVDAATWASISRHGIDPAEALRQHDAYPALDAAGALLRSGATGTNVNDLVIVLLASPS